MASVRSPCRVSVVIPVFNGAAYLGEAIDSVLAQSCPPTETIVVDDGSTDGSGGIARRYGSRVRVLQQANRGQAAALNAGVAAAAGELVAFLDADDLWLPDKLARQVERFDARPDLDYCVTRIQNFLSPEHAGAGEAIDPALLRDAPGYVVTTLVARRRLFDDIGGFDVDLKHANKTDWFLRARSAGATGEDVGEVLVRRRLHRNNLSQKYARRSLDEYLRLVKQSLDRRRGIGAG